MKKCRKHVKQIADADPRPDISPGYINYAGVFRLIWCIKCGRILSGRFVPLTNEDPRTLGYYLKKRA